MTAYLIFYGGKKKKGLKKLHVLVPSHTSPVPLVDSALSNQ